MNKYKYSENELEIKERVMNPRRPNEAGKPVFAFPCTEKEAVNAMYRGEAVWLPYGVENKVFCPEIIPDNVARGLVRAAESKNYTAKDFGGKDMFGIEWVYDEHVGGSMEKPGVPHILEGDVFDWKKKLVFPDIDSWDWDKSARENAEYLSSGKANVFWLPNGMGFERLISFMGFEGAALAMLDEEQEDDLKELLCRLTDLYIGIVDRVCEAYGSLVDGFTLHDDWGSQMAPLFSERCAETFFVPGMKRFTDHVKARGKFADLHSCGHIEDRIGSIIRGGWQSWTPMAMNDTRRLQAEYGDRIIIACVPEMNQNLSNEENAARFVENCYRPDRPCTLSHYASGMVNEEFLKAVYKKSREMS